MKKDKYILSSKMFFKKKSFLFASLAVSFILSLTILLGYIVNNGIDVGTAVFCVCFAVTWLLMFIVISTLWIWMLIPDRENGLKEKRAVIHPVSEHLVLQVCLLLFWLIPWLAAWPGYFCYDAKAQYECWSGTVLMNDHQPLLHTIILCFLIDVGEKIFNSINAGIALYIGIQMLLLSAVFSRVIIEIRRSGVSRIAEIAAFLWYALFPTCTMFAVCSTKDSLFSGIALLYLLDIRSLLKQPGEYIGRRQNISRLIVLTVAMLLLRKNALYALIVFAVISVIMCKKARIALAFVQIASLASFVVISMVLIVSMNAYHSPQKNDMLCVPVQQMARVYNVYGEDFFTEDEKDVLYSLADKKVWKDYTELNADPIKLHLESEYLSENKTAVIGLWLNTLFRAPKQCITATLINTYQGWYPAAQVTGYQYLTGSTYSTGVSSYFECRVEKPGTLDSRLPGVFDFYWRVSRENLMQDIPVFGLLFTVGSQLWILIFAIGYCFASEKKRFILPMLFPLIQYCTTLLGPVALIRYNLLLFWGLPLWLLLVFDTRSEMIQEKLN